MKKLIIASALSIPLCWLANVEAQPAKPMVPACQLTIAQAPIVRGIKLGMSSAELLSAFPDSAAEVGIKTALAKADENFGVGDVALYPRNYSNKDRYQGIWGYNLILLDGRVVSMVVQYVGTEWPRVDDFIAKLVEAFHLPPATDWNPNPNFTVEKSLACDGFNVKASALNGQALLELSTSDWRKIQQERRTAAAEKKRREFKP